MKLCARCQTEFVATDWMCPSCSYLPSSVHGFPLLAPELAEGGAGFRPEVFEHLAALEAKNFWFRARNELVIWTMKRYFPSLRCYLEIGCGTGYVLAGVAEAYPHTVLTGSEVFSAGLPYAARRVAKAELLQMDARHIPYTGEFDVIGAFDVLEHIQEDTTVLTEMMRALRPGGGIILTVPQHPWLWSRRDDYACHVRRYRVGELKEKVERAGFQVQMQTSFVSLLLPAMVASRMVHGNEASDSNPLAELQLPSFLNAFFQRIMDAERQLIRYGMRWPIGGSLLLTARKPEAPR